MNFWSKHRLSLAIISAAGVVSIASAFFLFRRSPSAVDVSVNAMEAFSSADAHSLWPFVPSSEVVAYRLTEGKLQGLLDLCGFGSSVKPSGKIMIQDEPTTGNASSSRWFSVKGEEPVLFEVAAELREKHSVQLRLPVTGLIFLALHLQGAQGDEKSRTEVFIQGIDHGRSRLESLGFNGVISGKTNSFVRWDGLRDEMVERQRSFESRQSSRTEQVSMPVR
jgi:hypothetical protein